jgi:hypothetical protein
LRGLFAPPPSATAHAFGHSLDELKTQALGAHNGQDMRAMLQSLLLERVASVQGTGKKLFAVDTPRLIDALAGEPPTGPVPDGLPEDIRRFIPTLSEARLERSTKPAIEQLRLFRTNIADFVDANFDKNAFVNDLRSIIPLLQTTDCWPPDSHIKLREFETNLSEFQRSGFVDLIDKATIILSEADQKQIAKLLNALGTIDFGLIERTMSFLSITNEILSQAERTVAQQEKVRGQSDPAAAAAAIVKLLETVRDSVEGSMEAHL